MAKNEKKAKKGKEVKKAKVPALFHRPTITNQRDISNGLISLVALVVGTDNLPNINPTAPLDDIFSASQWKEFRRAVEESYGVQLKRKKLKSDTYLGVIAFIAEAYGLPEQPSTGKETKRKLDANISEVVGPDGEPVEMKTVKPDIQTVYEAFHRYHLKTVSAMNKHGIREQEAWVSALDKAREELRVELRDLNLERHINWL